MNLDDKKRRIDELIETLNEMYALFGVEYLPSEALLIESPV